MKSPTGRGPSRSAIAAQAAASEVLPRSAREVVRALLASEAKFRALLEAAPDAMMIHGTDGRIQIVNAQAEGLFGYRREELIGQTMEMLMPERFRDRHVRHRQSFAAHSPPRPMGTGLNLLALHKNGREIPVEISLSNLGEGDETMVISSIRDITERKQAENVVRQLNEELEQRVETRTAELRRAYETIQREMTTRRRLEQEILEISERERRRIGQDLHDDLGQQLAGAWCLSQALENDLQAAGSSEATSAARVTTTLQNALALTRSLARGLHPVAIEAGGLGAALKELATRTSALFPVRCQCHVPSDMPDLDPVTATHLYRIAQESVTNAVKHGKATQIAMTLELAPPDAVLAIEDNGCGLPATAACAEGMGLRIMPYRADMIGGRLELTGGPDGGTVITCTFPLTLRSSEISTP